MIKISGSSSTGRPEGRPTLRGFVRNKANSWHLFLQAKQWGCRPSELLGLPRENYEAYCLDEAIGFFGGWVEAQLAKIEPPKGYKGDYKRWVEGRQMLFMRKLFAAEVSSPQFVDPAVKLAELKKGGGINRHL